MAVILEKQGNYNEAIALATQALEQGWAGDWEKRIAQVQAETGPQNVVGPLM